MISQTIDINHLRDPVLYDSAFLNFPKDQLWRLFIDLAYQKENDPYIFDKDRTVYSHIIKGERGYHNSMRNGFDYIRETIGQKLTLELFKEIHSRCTHQVQHTDGGQFSDKFSFEIDDCLMVYPFSLSFHPSDYDLTLDALEECEAKKLICWSENFPVSDWHTLDKAHTIFQDFLSIHVDPPSSIRSNAYYHDKPADKIKNLIDLYYTAIEQANSDDNKLEAIANLCRALEIYHVFTDGNQRTIAFALLTKLLIENGFKPSIIERPDMFDGYYTTKKMVEAIKTGMELFESHKTHTPE